MPYQRALVNQLGFQNQNLPVTRPLLSHWAISPPHCKTHTNDCLYIYENVELCLILEYPLPSTSQNSAKDSHGNRSSSYMSNNWKVSKEVRRYKPRYQSSEQCKKERVLKVTCTHTKWLLWTKLSPALSNISLFLTKLARLTDHVSPVVWVMSLSRSTIVVGWGKRGRGGGEGIH